MIQNVDQWQSLHSETLETHHSEDEHMGGRNMSVITL